MTVIPETLMFVVGDGNVNLKCKKKKFSKWKERNTHQNSRTNGYELQQRVKQLDGLVCLARVTDVL